MSGEVYNTGTVAVANGGTAVTGASTTWLTSGIRAGDLFWAAGLSVRIATVNSNTSITLAAAWPGTTLSSGSNYEIRYIFDGERGLAATNALISTLSNGNVAAVAGLTTVADRLMYWTGAGAATLMQFLAWARSFNAAANVAGARTILEVAAAVDSVLVASSQAITGFKTFKRSNATTLTEYFRCEPTDMAAGKPYFYFQKSATADRWTFGIFDTVGNDGTVSISSSGFIATGAYTATTANAANVNVAADGKLARSTSSEKYKTDIERMADEYADVILKMEPIWYRSICAGDNPEHSFWGLSAERVAELDPRLVHWRTHEMVTKTIDRKVVEEIDGKKVWRVEKTPVTEAVALKKPEPEGVAYERLTVHLISVVKRQQKQIDALTARLDALEG